MLSTTTTVTDAGGHTGSGIATVLVAGVDTAALVGGITSTVSANVTHSTPGQAFNHVDFNGARVSATTTDLTYNDCIFRGDNSINALFSATNINAKRIVFNRCWFIPKYPLPDKNNIVGHDFWLNDCLVEKGSDNLSIQNSGQYAATGPGWATGVGGRRTVIRRLARWTSATMNLGPGDTVNHADGIQQFGGVGTDFEDSIIDSRPALQFAHLVLQSPAGHVYTEAEAYALADDAPLISVPMGSLANGGPFASPAFDATHPARPLPWVSNGTGLISRGELNSTDYSALMCNSSQGYSAGFRFVNVHWYGGEFCINSGGNQYPAGSGISWGTMTDCRFDRSQGQQGHTVDLQGNWSGHATIPTTGAGANLYFDGTPVTVRF